MSTIMSTVEPNDTPRSSQRSSVSAALSPTWRSPKAPLPPHRLAKLANALGVSTPLPASLNYPSSGAPSFLSRSVSESAGPPDYLRRSPTPSATSSRSFAPPNPQTSKFLLHVVPPMHLPHDSDASNDSDMTPPPPTASGYHTQFRRGTLVPVHPTLQAQLGAIAKEYALPSTAGMVLYLVSSGTASSVQSPVSPDLSDDLHEPGPRLSEDIWRHLWTRVVQAEQRDGNMLLPPRSPTPLTLASPSTPFLPQEFNRNQQPFLSPSPSPSPISPRPSYPLVATSPSPASSFSDLRSNTKSAPPSSASATQSEPPDTPNTSISELRADSYDLPGLNSPSLIPILAKVEFDIDRRKAGWYDRWLKSRRDNHAKRLGGRKNSMPEQTGEASDKAKDKTPVIPLMIGRKETASPLGILPSDPSSESTIEAAGYEQLSDTQEGDDSDSEDDMDDFAEDSTARVSSIVEKKDPLEDVFGSDADTWQDMKAERRNTHEIDPDGIDLSLTAGDLSEEASFGGDMDESRFTTREEEEVRELLDRMSQSGKTTPDPFSASSPQSITKKIPPPLVLVPNDSSSPIVAAEASPLPSATTTGAKLAYLDSPEKESDLEGNEYRSRSPSESEKRAGALFEDLDLGLDPSEDYDDDDPNDRRKSQIVMRQQLDEIERTLAQLSPRFANTDLEEEMDKSYNSLSTLSPGSPMKLTLSPLRNSETTASRLAQHSDRPEGGPSSGASWPAVPFSQIKDTSSSSSDGANRPPSPPKLALNGVTTSAPPSFKPHAGDEVSPETILRKQKLEEEQGLFRKPSTDSPVIPLSPDPFGRYSSSTLDPPIISAPEGWDTVTVGRTSAQLGDGENQDTPTKRARSGTTSRFSTDSLVEPAPVAAPAKSNRGTLMSVKSIKNLWRKSNKGDKEKEKEKAEKAQAGSASGRMSPAVPQRPERPSQETLDLPDVPPLPPNASFGRISPQPIPGSSDMNRRPSQDSGMQGRASLEQSRRPSGEMPPPPPRPPQGVPAQVMYPGLSVPPYANATRTNTQPIIPAQMLSNRPGSDLVNLRFDQESPYPNPVRNPPPQRYGGQRPPSPAQTSPPPHMQAHSSQLQSIPEQEALARRSLSQKWNSGSSNGQNHFPQDPPGQQQYQPQHQQRVSFDRQSNASVRTNGSYAPSLNGRKTSISSDLAPQLSPRVPDHFAGRPSFTGSEHSMRSPTSPNPMEQSSSPPTQYHRPLGARSVSPAASFASSHASIDESQFEIVSPKMHGGMGYPTVHYNGNVGSS